METKVCKKCSIDKPISNFSVAKDNRDGLNNICKKCKCEYSKNYTLNNFNEISIKRKKFYNINKDRLLNPETYVLIHNKICSVCNDDKAICEFNKNKKSNDGYRADCKICQAKKGKIYRLNNVDKLKQYRLDNKNNINQYRKNKKQTDINYKITCNLRTRLWSAIKNEYKSGSAVSDLGCSIEYFKNYIELKFEDKMSWDTWGRDTWHLDHVKPLSSFNLSNREEFLIAVNYKNIKPMWCKDNLSKGGVKNVHA